MKRKWIIIGLIIPIISCTSPERKKRPVPSAKTMLNSVMELKSSDSIHSVLYEPGPRSIDASYFFKFQCNDRTIRDITRRKQMKNEPHSIMVRKKPDWFNIPDSPGVKHYFYIKEMWYYEILVYDPENKTAYYYYSKM